MSFELKEIAYYIKCKYNAYQVQDFDWHIISIDIII